MKQLYLVGLMGLLWGYGFVQSQTARLTFTPPELEILLNQTTTQHVELVTAPEFVGGSMALTYDPRVVKLAHVEAGEVLSRLKIERDYFLEVSPPEMIDEQTARLTLKLTLIDAETAPLAQGIWLDLTWQGVALSASSQVALEAELMRPDGVTVTPNVEVSTVQVVQTLKPATIQLKLQGDKSLVPIETTSTIHQAMLNVDGVTLVVPVTGELTLTSSPPYTKITATRPGYLATVAKNVIRSTDLTTMTLLAGDVTQDGLVNIFDLSQMAAHYGADVPTIQPPAELEICNYMTVGSSAQRIDILDLALAARNYGQSAPIVMETPK